MTDNGRHGGILEQEIPPNSPDAELAVLGSICLSTEAMDGAARILTPAMFYHPLHRVLFAVAMELNRDGVPVDAVTLADHAPEAQAPSGGWMPYLAKLLEAVPHAAHVLHYAEIVAQTARARAVQQELRGMAEDLPSSIEDICKRINEAAIGGNTSPITPMLHGLPLPLPRVDTAGFVAFPVDCLPPFLAEYIEQVARAVGADPSFVAMPVLSALSACVGNSRALRVKEGWIVTTPVWTACVGESGTGKSPAQSIVLRPLHAMQTRWMNDFKEQMERHKQDLALYEADSTQWKRKGRTEGEPPPDAPDAPVCRRLIVSDTTIEE